MSNLRMKLCGDLVKAFVGVHLLSWIVTYPVDKVIRSLNNWGVASRIHTNFQTCFLQ